MTTETNQPASAATEPKTGEVLEQPKTQQVAPPASDTPAEEWDPKRAMETIRTLREIEKKAKADAKELEKLKAEEQKRKDAELTEVERLKKQADELAKQKVELELSILRRDVIAETGLPAVFAERLKGATKDEMLADAKTLKDALPQTKQPGQTVTNPGNASQTETEAQMRERLFGKPARIFDINEIKKGGGGVVFNTKE